LDIGKFYEMYQMDCDVGVDVLNLIYMKGHVAHGGFPEISYGYMADKLCRAGYKVARVEQTETPDQLKIRKENTRKGQKKPQVVNREVCSILTLGTRTFCFLDDANALSNSMTNGSEVGPLLSIREVLVNDPTTTTTNSNMEQQQQIEQQQEQEDHVQPTCEYGISLVDAVNGTVTIGQFADDVLRSRMNTLLTAFGPSEILISPDASPILMSQIKAYQNSSRNGTRVETIAATEAFPKSTALEARHRALVQRKTSVVHPWDLEETIQELHRRGYYPRGSKQQDTDSLNTSRWPKVLQAAIDGNAELCLSSLGAALFYLQRNLIDQEILSMGIVKAYIPPASSCIMKNNDSCNTEATLQQNAEQGEELSTSTPPATTATALEGIQPVISTEDQIKNMSLDGTTLHNLEILTNAVDHKPNGSLWSKINYTKTPHGSRLLRAWLLRPLFRKVDIERRADAVQELVAGAGAVALNEARQTILGKIGDLDRLLSRLHSMSGPTDHNDDSEAYHPSERAVLYESVTYTKRKVGDFSKLLNGLRQSCQIPDLFADLELEDGGLLQKIARFTTDGGFFPVMADELDWYFANFDCDKAAKGEFEPSRGCDQAYDDACDTIERIKAELEDYGHEMCNELKPRHTAKSSWKYANTKPNSKDKYLIELPASIQVPSDFQVKGKRGSGHKQVNKYRTSFVAGLIPELEQAFEVQKFRKAKGMQLVFARFNKQRSLWAAAAHTTALLDALGSLAKVAAKPGYCRPTILECPPDQEPTINIAQGRHPCVESSINSTEFIPNDLALGRSGDASRLLLLSGPNMVRSLCRSTVSIFYSLLTPRILRYHDLSCRVEKVHCCARHA
jgi:DNA mismatch repair protein MSH6